MRFCHVRGFVMRGLLCMALVAGVIAGLSAQSEDERRAAALRDLLSLAQKVGVAESDITLAVFEGRLNPDWQLLARAWEALGAVASPDPTGPGFDVAKSNAEWNRRFGNISSATRINTIISGRPVTKTGRDFLFRSAVQAESRNERMGRQRTPALRFASIEVYAMSWQATYAGGRDLLKDDPNALRALDEAMAYWDGRERILGYINNDDYSDLRDTRFVANPLIGGQPRTLRPRFTSEELESEGRKWSYVHGKGFIVSAARLDAEEMAEVIVGGSGHESLERTMTLPGEDPDAWFAGRTDLKEMPRFEAAALRLGVVRRREAQQVLATIPGWTRARLQTLRAGAYAGPEDVIRAALDGDFKRFLGRDGSGPVGLWRRPRATFVDRALLSYHIAYGQLCKGRGALPFKPYGFQYEVTTELITTRGLQRTRQIVGREDVGAPHIWNLREPFGDEALRRWRLAQERASDSYAYTASDNPDPEDMAKGFAGFITSAGCDSDLTKQFEVNLWLLADGFPPLQQLLP
jgi:hypothetical protein